MNPFGWATHSVTPTTDLFLWVRWFVAVALVWWLPGRLLLHGRLQEWPRALALYARLAAGFAWVVALGLLMRWLGRGMDPLIYAAVSPLLACAVGRILAGSRPRGTPAAGNPGWWAVGVACLGLFVAMVVGFADLPAPPHVHDASNHAWMVVRATETGSLDPARIFADLRPHKVYFSGWHLVAAITGQVGSIAPYVATWFTAITCTALVPLALVTLWWRWGAGPAIAVAGSLWVMTNSDNPAGNPFSWGGFGVMVGYFIVPLGAILAAEALRSRRAIPALAAGAWFAVTIHVHFSDVVVLVLLAVLTAWMGARHESAHARGAWWVAAVLFVAGLALAWVPAMFTGASSYAHDIGGLGAGVKTEGFVRAVRSFPQGIGPPDLRFPWAIGGVILLLMMRRWRPVAVACLLLAFWVFAMKYWYDPVSRTLATPFYGQVTRVYYQQIYLIPLAAGTATVIALRFATRRGRGWVPVAGLLVLVPLVLGYAKHHRNLASLEHSIPFDRNEYVLAREIETTVPPGEVVANYRDDGSTWAWHVSGRPFLNPLSWGCTTPDGTDPMAAAHGLAEDPWHDRTRALRGRGVRWLYVSSRRLDDPGLLEPGDFAGDPRFSVVLERAGTQLLRIDWDH